MKKVKHFILLFSLLYIGAVNAQENIEKFNFDLGFGTNQYMPKMADSLNKTYTDITTFNRNILLRASVNLNYKFSLQLGGNFVSSQNTSISKSTGFFYVENLKVNIFTVKICNYLVDSTQEGFSVYWNLGVLYLNSNYAFRKTMPASKDIIINKDNFLPNVGYEGAIGIRIKSPYSFGMFVEAGFNKLDDKMRAVIQGGISFYLY